VRWRREALRRVAAPDDVDAVATAADRGHRFLAGAFRQVLGAQVLGALRDDGARERCHDHRERRFAEHVSSALSSEHCASPEDSRPIDAAAVVTYPRGAQLFRQADKKGRSFPCRGSLSARSIFINAKRARTVAGASQFSQPVGAVVIEAADDAGTVDEVMVLVGDRIVDAVSPKVPKLGDLRNALAAARICALGEFSRMSDDPVAGIEAVEGMLAVPDRPGCGVAPVAGPSQSKRTGAA
jgi:hypothetical protein